MQRPPVELHRLISQTVVNPSLNEQLRCDARSVYTHFGIPADQQALLLADPRKALATLNVHPNLQFKFLAALGLLGLKPASIQPYLETPHGQAR
ncbi:hypothetical protein [Pigmentiphaga sp.]|uniref:hypothetical protein n=1 Tax=Pigmentiphaga sp. TaxID=1977564 RepID=UPI0025F2BF93|nr:hypothetical protein [Pigmentiphaga sp.]